MPLKISLTEKSKYPGDEFAYFECSDGRHVLCRTVTACYGGTGPASPFRVASGALGIWCKSSQ